MKKIFALLLIFLITSTVTAQMKLGKEHSKLNISCQTCHTCEVPTKNDPCLVVCPREKMVTIYQKPEETPELIVIDQLKDRYGPVYFSHRLHAQMSEMSGGCGGCHHFNTTGPILNCNSCHETSRKRNDVSVPDLKGAYHRQCMDCHREWSHSTACNSCHLPIKEVKGTEKEQIAQRLKGRAHPVVLEPVKILYRTESDKGKLVTFYHDDHTKKFNLDCISCHKQESCSSCHDVNKKSSDSKTKVSDASKSKLSFEVQHKNCISCHKDDNCTRCHSDKELMPFDHQRSTGWTLKTYHAKLTCQNCHGSKIPFAKIDKNCISCHKDWDNETFNHAVTGLKLDELHSELGCDDCHADNNYAIKPACDNCHDDLSYPKDLPGKLIRK
jgi:hypothetical protein